MTDRQLIAAVAGVLLAVLGFLGSLIITEIIQFNRDQARTHLRISDLAERVARLEGASARPSYPDGWRSP